MTGKSLRLAGLGLAAFSGLVFGAAPAVAQNALFAAKSEAILGAPSRLAALVAQQTGQALPVPIATPAAAPQPAGSGRVSFTPETPALMRPAIATDRPDVFGSVALPITRSPLDARWGQVRHLRAGGRAAAWASALRDSGLEQRIEAVNRFVNERVTFTDDLRQYRRADVWQSAAETLRRGRGDCEDYAIAKLQLLRAAGIAADDLYLVIAKDLVRRSDHAVLVVRAGDRMLLLDNMTDRITDATLQQDYRPILTYAAAGRSWTHGYRRELPPVQVAQVAAAPVEVAAAPIATVAVASLAASALR